MDNTAPRDRDFVVDIESGGTISEETGSSDPVSGLKLAKMFFVKVCRGFVTVDGNAEGENRVSFRAPASNCDDLSPESGRLLIDKKLEGEEAADLVEKNTAKEKRKKTSAKKPQKPPRPPRGLSLDAADQKLIKEIAELTMLKRARVERIKALKKMKAAKSSSSNGNLFAILFTIIFCLVMIFQGMSSRSSSTISFQGSPKSAGATEVDFIMVQNPWNPSASYTNISDSGSLNIVEQVSGSNPVGKVSSAAG